VYEVGDIVEIQGRGEGWDGVQCRIVNTFQQGSGYVDLEIDEDTPVTPPTHRKRGEFIGMWFKTSIRYPISQPTKETYEID
jgi:hypothetical protein